MSLSFVAEQTSGIVKGWLSNSVGSDGAWVQRRLGASASAAGGRAEHAEFGATRVVERHPDRLKRHRSGMVGLFDALGIEQAVIGPTHRGFSK
jgi:hypothetical protein